MTESLLARLRRIVPKAACAVLAGAVIGAHAAYPDRPIRLIVGMPPGGGADYVARLVVGKASERLGQNIVIENRPGADGVIAAQVVAQAKPDGYTLAWVTNSHVVAPLFHQLSYDAAKSFNAVIEAATAPDILLVPSSFPANSIADLIKQAKQRPNAIVFGSAGLATPSSLETELFMKQTGTRMLAVPYKGGSDVILALLNGSVNMYFATISTAISNLNGGKLKALAVTSKQRSPQFPNLPTVAEAIHQPDFEGGTWLGVLAPARTPKAVIDALNGAFATALKSPEVQTRLSALGWSVIASSPDQFSQVISADMLRWASALKGTRAQ